MNTLVLGGVRSGKSRHAADIAARHAGPVTLIATATALDAEMTARIEAHRAGRPTHWTVVEEPLRLAAALESAARPDGVILVDCLTLWLTNLLCGDDADAHAREVDALLRALPTLPGTHVLISNETGFGVIPANALARRFVDAAGTLHQQLAALSDRVVLMVAGIPMLIKDRPRA